MFGGIQGSNLEGFDKSLVLELQVTIHESYYCLIRYQSRKTGQRRRKRCPEVAVPVSTRDVSWACATNFLRCGVTGRVRKLALGPRSLDRALSLGSDHCPLPATLGAVMWGSMVAARRTNALRVVRMATLASVLDESGRSSWLERGCLTDVGEGVRLLLLSVPAMHE